MRILRLRPRRKSFVLAAIAVVLFGAAAAFAALPTISVPPESVTEGTRATTSINVLSVDAFVRAITHAHGTNSVLQHVVFEPGESTLWHRHPGPNVILVVGGSLTLWDEHCEETTYQPGQGFATGIKTHLAVAGPQGADFYSLYVLPADADVLRIPPLGVDAGPPKCWGRR